MTISWCFCLRESLHVQHHFVGSNSPSHASGNRQGCTPDPKVPLWAIVFSSPRILKNENTSYLGMGTLLPIGSMGLDYLPTLGEKCYIQGEMQVNIPIPWILWVRGTPVLVPWFPGLQDSLLCKEGNLIAVRSQWMIYGICTNFQSTIKQLSNKTFINDMNHEILIDLYGSLEWLILNCINWMTMT